MNCKSNFHENTEKYLSSLQNESNNLNHYTTTQNEGSASFLVMHDKNVERSNAFQAELTENTFFYDTMEIDGSYCDGAKASSTNQRILEDLSHSKPISVSGFNNTDAEKYSHGSLEHQNQNVSRLEQQPHMQTSSHESSQVIDHTGSVYPQEGNGTSIHISFSENNIQEERDQRRVHYRTLGINEISKGSFEGDINKNGNRSLRVHLHSDLAYVERTKLEKKRERNRLAASKCRQRKMEKIQTLEEQVEDLQNQIKKLKEHVSNLNEENEGLKYELSTNNFIHGKGNDNAACKCLMSGSYDEKCSYQGEAQKNPSMPSVEKSKCVTNSDNVISSEIRKLNGFEVTKVNGQSFTRKGGFSYDRKSISDIEANVCVGPDSTSLEFGDKT